MAICSPLVGIPKDCGDNNLGAIKRALIGSFEDVTGLTVTATSAPDTDGEVTAVTRTVGTKFEDFPLPKDTSMFSQEWTGDLVADTHSYTQTCELGFNIVDFMKTTLSRKIGVRVDFKFQPSYTNAEEIYFHIF